MTHYRKFLFTLLVCAAAPAVATAQNPQPAPPQVTPAPVAPPSAAQPPPEQIAPRDNTDLSGRLSAQQGTLHPPMVDPGINAPLPPRASGSMPVIPPPGTPGGNPSVVPK